MVMSMGPSRLPILADSVFFKPCAGALTELLLERRLGARALTCTCVIAGSAVMELPVDFVSGAILGFIPGDKDIEFLEDMLGLLDESLELFPGFGCGATS